MSNYFQLFPRILYDINRNGQSEFNVVTNIFFRLAFLETIKHKAVTYYEYVVQEGDTPELLAEKYYGDPESHWVILLVNDMVDPVYDWVLHYEQFNRYIEAKYGSVANAQLQIHHSNQIIRRTDTHGLTTNTQLQIDTTSVNANISVSCPTLPYNYVGNLPLAEPAGIQYALPNGESVREAVFYRQQTAWDFEVEQNEKKRTIKLIRKEYYRQIQAEFQNLVQRNNESLRFGLRDPNA